MLESSFVINLSAHRQTVQGSHAHPFMNFGWSKEAKIWYSNTVKPYLLEEKGYLFSKEENVMLLYIFSSKQLHIFLALLCKLRSLDFPGIPDQSFGTSSSLSTQEDKETFPMSAPPAISQSQLICTSLRGQSRWQSKHRKSRETRTENKDRQAPWQEDPIQQLLHSICLWKSWQCDTSQHHSLCSLGEPEAPRSLGAASLSLAWLLEKRLGTIDWEKYQDRNAAQACFLRVLAESLYRVVKTIPLSSCGSAGGHHWYKGQNSDFSSQNINSHCFTKAAVVQEHTTTFNHSVTWRPCVTWEHSLLRQNFSLPSLICKSPSVGLF